LGSIAGGKGIKVKVETLSIESVKQETFKAFKPKKRSNVKKEFLNTDIQYTVVQTVASGDESDDAGSNKIIEEVLLAYAEAMKEREKEEDIDDLHTVGKTQLGDVSGGGVRGDQLVSDVCEEHTTDPVKPPSPRPTGVDEDGTRVVVGVGKSKRRAMSVCSSGGHGKRARHSYETRKHSSRSEVVRDKRNASEKELVRGSRALSFEGDEQLSERGGQLSEGGEQLSEGGEQLSEGGEQSSEGGKQSSERGEQSSQRGEQSTEGGEQSSDESPKQSLHCKVKIRKLKDKEGRNCFKVVTRESPRKRDKQLKYQHNRERRGHHLKYDLGARGCPEREDQVDVDEGGEGFIDEGGEGFKRKKRDVKKFHRRERKDITGSDHSLLGTDSSQRISEDEGREFISLKPRRARFEDSNAETTRPLRSRTLTPTRGGASDSVTSQHCALSVDVTASALSLNTSAQAAVIVSRMGNALFSSLSANVAEEGRRHATSTSGGGKLNGSEENGKSIKLSDEKKYVQFYKVNEGKRFKSDKPRKEEEDGKDDRLKTDVRKHTSDTHRFENLNFVTYVLTFLSFSGKP